jgi:hypothetical protein
LTDFPNSSKIISRMEMKKKTRPLAAGIEPTSFWRDQSERFLWS